MKDNKLPTSPRAQLLYPLALQILPLLSANRVLTPSLLAINICYFLKIFFTVKN